MENSPLGLYHIYLNIEGLTKALIKQVSIIDLDLTCTPTMADVQAVLSALAVFDGVPDKVSLERANTWLQDFQHSVIVFAYGHSRQQL